MHDDVQSCRITSLKRTNRLSRETRETANDGTTDRGREKPIRFGRFVLGKDEGGRGEVDTKNTSFSPVAVSTHRVCNLKYLHALKQLQYTIHVYCSEQNCFYIKIFLSFVGKVRSETG